MCHGVDGGGSIKPDRGSRSKTLGQYGHSNQPSSYSIYVSVPHPVRRRQKYVRDILAKMLCRKYLWAGLYW